MSLRKHIAAGWAALFPVFEVREETIGGLTSFTIYRRRFGRAVAVEHWATLDAAAVRLAVLRGARPESVPIENERLIAAHLTDQQMSTLGVHAQQLLANPAFQAVFERMRDTVAHAWRNADLRDVDGQQLLLQQAKVIDRVREAAFGMVQAGKLADGRIREANLRVEAKRPRGARKLG